MTRRNRRFRERRRPSRIEPVWQGVPLALEQLEDLQYQIRGALQPLRADIIDRATKTSLVIIEQLERAWEALPPGAVPFRATERRALSGLPGAVSPQTREEIEEEEEEEERERRRRRRERDDDDDRDDDRDRDRDRDDDDDDDDRDDRR